MNLPPQSQLTDKKYQAILGLIRTLGVNLADIEEKIAKGGGHGGQKRNKSNNVVQLKHIPTGILVRYGQERPLAMNRILALRELLEKLNPHSKKQTASERIRKQKARRARRQAKAAD